MDFEENKNYFIAGGIVIVLLIIITIYMKPMTVDVKNLLNGFWEAPKSFCDDSGLDLFVITIGTNGRGYILAFKENECFINAPTRIDVSLGQSTTKNKMLKLTGTMSFPDLKKNNEYKTDFPTKFDIDYFPTSSKIILHKGKKIFLALYKNNEASENSSL